jgi:hypothetical protein
VAVGVWHITGKGAPGVWHITAEVHLVRTSVFIGSTYPNVIEYV